MTTTSLDTFRQMLLDRHPDVVPVPTQVALKILARLEAHAVTCEHLAPNEVSDQVLDQIVDALSITYAVLSLSPEWISNPIIQMAAAALSEEFGDDVTDDLQTKGDIQ